MDRDHFHEAESMASRIPADGRGRAVGLH
jgi:hypothetical protein